jgi:hypothetical protein
MFIYEPFIEQNISNARNICCNPSALWETRTASSAKASRKIYRVAISKIYLFVGAILFSSKHCSKYGYI